MCCPKVRVWSLFFLGLWSLLSLGFGRGAGGGGLKPSVKKGMGASQDRAKSAK